MAFEKIKDWLFGPEGRWFLIWISLLALTIIIVVLASLAKQPWGEVTCDRIFGYASEQCELINKDGFLRQQANFWSNFAYLYVGLKILCQYESIIAKATGIGFIFLWLGSGLFHGTLTEWGQYLDIMGIYVVLLLLILHAVVETRSQGELDTALAYLWSILFAVLGLLMGWKKGFFESTLVSVASGLILTLIGFYGSGRQHKDWYDERRCYRPLGIRFPKWLLPGLLAATLFGGAAAFKFADGKDITNVDCRKYDQTGQVVKEDCFNCQVVRDAPVADCQGKCPDGACCDAVCLCCQDVAQGEAQSSNCKELKAKPFCFGTNPVIQGHALWHVFSAIGMLYIFKFFVALNWRTERP